MKNILITSAGKRVELLKLFIDTLRGYDQNAKVLTTDLNPKLAPVSFFSECVRMPRVTDSEYSGALLEVCANNNIGLIIPTIDTELKVLSDKREEFLNHGVDVAVSDRWFIDSCRDKCKTHEFFSRCGIDVPRVIELNNPVFPLFGRPVDGSCSKGVFVAHNETELRANIKKGEYFLTEYIDKNEFTEFTVDVYFGKDSLIKSVVPRERIEIRAGEINKGITRKNNIISRIISAFDCMSGVRGVVCIQLFYSYKTDQLFGIEINPRFGGGYPLSYAAGADFPKMMIEEYLLGNDINYSDSWDDGVLMLRFDSSVFKKIQ